MPSKVIDIDTYLDSIGLKRHRNVNQFWSYMDSRYSRNQICDLEKAYMKLERGDEEAFYAEIFQNLKLSLDFASLRHNLYYSYLEWFVKLIEKPPGLIVDAGCGNAILTCFYAKLFPDAKVVGFDISEVGIACAKELGDQLGLHNVEFVTADLNDLSLPIEKESADLIVSVASTGPPAAAPNETPIYELFNRKPRIGELHQVALLAPYLEPRDGIFVSFDKVANLNNQVRWSHIIQSAGLGISLSRSGWIGYENIESDTITLPALVAGRAIKPSSPDDLIAFFATKNANLENWVLDFGQEALAEVVFTYINPRKFIRGARANYRDGSGIYWYELWQAGPFAITFEHTDQGFRTLHVVSLVDLPSRLIAFDEWIEQTSAYADVVELSEPEIHFQPCAQ